MPRYLIVGIVKGYKYLGEIEADTLEEAAAVASSPDNGYIKTCYECIDECSNIGVRDVDVDVAVAVAPLEDRAGDHSEWQ